MNDKLETVIELLAALLPREGTLATSIKGLGLFRIEHSFPRTPYSYDSEIIILAQGEKRAYLGDDAYAYDPSRYLVLPVPMPLECEGKAPPGKPILGLTIAVDPMEVGEIMLDIEDDRKEARSLPRGIYGAPMNEALYDAAARLLRAISDAQDRKALAPMIKREIIYRALRGEGGEVLQALARRNRRFFQISKALRRIHESYGSAFDIERLAKELDMSSSTFHSSFKAVTNTSPLQYIKNVRLHEARSLMIRDGLAASAAASRVGYESPSQFSREYKRLFGEAPARDASALRGGRAAAPEMD